MIRDFLRYILNLYLILERFSTLSDELLNPTHGWSAIGAERPIITPIFFSIYDVVVRIYLSRILWPQGLMSPG